MARTVLIADDSPTVQKKASGVLTGEGIEVVTVSNGVAAIKKLPTARPLVVLADVSMPGKDGYEVCEFIKSSPDFIRVPVVLVFSDDDVYDEQRGARAGADGRIKKPFDHDELVAVVGKFISRSESAQSEPRLKDTMTPAASARPEVVTEPVDEEPTISPRQPVHDFGALTGEFGIDGPMPDESSAVALEGKEHGVATEMPSSPISAMEATPDELAAPGVPPAISEPKPMVSSEPSARLDAELAATPMPAEAPNEESAAASGTAVAEEESAGPSAVAAHEFSASEVSQPPVVESAVAPPSAEPALIEEESAPPAAPAEPPIAQRTMVFRVPADIAEPVLKDELSPQPPEPEMAPPPPESEAESASNLENFSLDEATTGHVRLSGSEEGVVTEETPPPAAAAIEVPSPAPLAVAPAYQYDQVYEIVCKVVARMSPNALPLPVIEEMSKTITNEIMEELNSPPS